MSADEKPTVEIAAPPPWAIELTKRVTSGFVEMKADISIVANDVSITKDRLGVVEGRILVLEDARKVTSMRVGAASDVDLAHEAQLAQERAAREELAVKVKSIDEKQDAQTAALVSIASDVGKFLATPRVKVAGGIIFGLFLKYLADHFGVHL